MRSERPALRDSLACALEHLRRLVEADDAAAIAPHEAACDRARARRHVEHPGVRPDRHVLDQESPPAGVLREREDRGPAVVITAERGEEGTRRIVDRTVPVHVLLLRRSLWMLPAHGLHASAGGDLTRQSDVRLDSARARRDRHRRRVRGRHGSARADARGPRLHADRGARPARRPHLARELGRRRRSRWAAAGCTGISRYAWAELTRAGQGIGESDGARARCRGRSTACAAAGTDGRAPRDHAARLGQASSRPPPASCRARTTRSSRSPRSRRYDAQTIAQRIDELDLDAEERDVLGGRVRGARPTATSTTPAPSACCAGTRSRAAASSSRGDGRRLHVRRRHGAA